MVTHICQNCQDGTLSRVNYVLVFLCFVLFFKGEKVIWEHMRKIMNGDLQESSWECKM